MHGAPWKATFSRSHYDLVTPDGCLTSIDRNFPDQMEVKIIYSKYFIPHLSAFKLKKNTSLSILKAHWPNWVYMVITLRLMSSITPNLLSRSA